MMTLNNIIKGQNMEIININNPLVKAQAIRLGLYEGAVLKCSEKLPSGPVILKSKIQEIAVGRKLAEQITIKPI